MIVTKNELANIDTNFDQFDSIGLRVVNEEYNDYNAIVGDVLDPSSVWDDGDYSEEKLTGTCAIDSRSIDRMGSNGGYIGDRVLVLGANNVEYGEDAGEIVMQSAVVLAVINL